MAMPTYLRVLEGMLLGTGLCVLIAGVSVALLNRYPLPYDNPRPPSHKDRLIGFSQIADALAAFALVLTLEWQSMAVFALGTVLFLGAFGLQWRANQLPTTPKAEKAT
jgi:hypothetical protein